METSSRELRLKRSEIHGDRLWYRQGRHIRKEGARIFGADRLGQWPFRWGCQLRKALDRNLGRRFVEQPETLDGVPGHGERTGILDVDARFQHLAAVGQAEALDPVQLL